MHTYASQSPFQTLSGLARLSLWLRRLQEMSFGGEQEADNRSPRDPKQGERGKIDKFDII